MLHFASKGKRFKKSIGYKCSLNHWDAVKQRIKTSKGMMVNAYKVNAFINDVQTYTEDTLSSMIKDSNIIDIEKLSNSINCKINGSEEESIKRENRTYSYYFFNKEGNETLRKQFST